MTCVRVGALLVQSKSRDVDEDGEEIGEVAGVDVVDDAGDADADASGNGYGLCGGSSNTTGSGGDGGAALISGDGARRRIHSLIASGMKKTSFETAKCRKLYLK